jgi:hypothetical protein
MVPLLTIEVLCYPRDVDKVSDINPEKCTQFVSNLLNNITGKLYIYEIPFQRYKEGLKWKPE